jgi:hypothetical protein
MRKIGIATALLAATMLSAAHADTLNITAIIDGQQSSWSDVAIYWGFRGFGGSGLNLAAGLGDLATNQLSASGPDRGFWLSAQASGVHQIEVVVTDQGIGTAGFNAFQFDFSPDLSGADWSNQTWNIGVLINGVPITSGQIIDVGNAPYSISAVFDVTTGISGIGNTGYSIDGSGGYSDFYVMPTPVSLPVNSVPGPIAGAGVPGLMAFAMLLLARWRKRRAA